MHLFESIQHLACYLFKEMIDMYSLCIPKYIHSILVLSRDGALPNGLVGRRLSKGPWLEVVKEINFLKVEI